MPGNEIVRMIATEAEPPCVRVFDPVISSVRYRMVDRRA